MYGMVKKQVNVKSYVRIMIEGVITYVQLLVLPQVVVRLVDTG